MISIRRALMARVESEQEELYPIGTDIINEYIGRGDNWTQHAVINSSGEFVLEPATDSFASDLYIPVDPDYTYQKNDYRVRRFAYYDSNYSFLSSVVYDNATRFDTFPALPSQAKWARIQTGNAANKNGLEITRIA